MQSPTYLVFSEAGHRPGLVFSVNHMNTPIMRMCTSCIVSSQVPFEREFHLKVKNFSTRLAGEGITCSDSFRK